MRWCNQNSRYEKLTLSHRQTSHSLRDIRIMPPRCASRSPEPLPAKRIRVLTARAQALVTNKASHKTAASSKPTQSEKAPPKSKDPPTNDKDTEPAKSLSASSESTAAGLAPEPTQKPNRRTCIQDVTDGDDEEDDFDEIIEVDVHGT